MSNEPTPNATAGPPAGVSAAERAVLFGPHRGLVGVVTQPAGAPAAAGSPTPRRAVVMANIGLSHHVGPFRLYVDLARAAAALGWYALRFDLSGLGDSLPRAGAATTSEQAAADVRAALDWVESSLGVREVVLVGLCSGVDTMHPVAVADPRVVGAVFVDGYTYPTLGYHVRRHTLRYLQLERWRRFVRPRSLRRRFARAAPATPADDAPQPVFQREYPTRARFRADVAEMAARRARLLFVFTGTFDASFNSERQMAEVLGRAVRRDQMRVAVFPRADHLFSAAAHRGAFFACVRQWLAEFPPAARGTAA
ncbi:hypothetical protein tb265_43840 [Gemmatimonadetes bacterium T265]|nr:hypothetical protein tb265_43840 [Gemmatimonadetes bacterium T265]